MSKDRRWLGREGETRAAHFLESRGYRIVARNVRADRVEIDLIACQGSLLAFVEVKTRRGSRRDDRLESRRAGRSYDRGAGRGTGRQAGREHDRGTTLPHASHGFAAEAVDARKQARLRHGAHAWLAANPALARRTRARRFDVVTCVLEEPRSGSEGGPARRTGIHDARNETTAPEAARWSIEHWQAAF